MRRIDALLPNPGADETAASERPRLSDRRHPVCDWLAPESTAVRIIQAFGDERLECGCLARDPNNGRAVIPHSCCTCQDAGFVARAGLAPQDPEFGKSVPCPDCGRRYEERFAARSRLPALFAGVRLKDFDPKPDREAVKAAYAFVKAWPPAKPFLVYRSPHTGNGKTMLAAGIQHAAHDKHKVLSEFWSAGELVNRYREASNPEGSERPQDLDEHFRRVPLLVVDDLGSEYRTARESDFATERLYSLVNDRYNNRKPTVITSNASAEDISQRVFSRLMDPQISTVVVLRGRDRRVQPSRLVGDA